MYLEAMRAHRPKGPYVLAGVSFGAVLAFEIARQLRALGEQVPLVILVDAVLPRAVRRGPGWYRHQLEQLRQEGLRGFRMRLRRLFDVALETRPAADSRATVHEIEALRQAFYDRAARRYDATPHPYDGRTVLIRASETDLVGYDLEPNLGWRAHVRGPFEVYQSEGDHLGVLSAPRTALIVRRELDRLVRAPLPSRAEL